MPRDVLPVLLRVRRLAVDTSRRALAQGLRAEAGAAARLTETEDTLRREGAVVSAVPPDGIAAATWSAWLPGGLRDRDAAAAEMAKASAGVAALRQDVADARARARALEVALERRDEARRMAEERQEHRALDEAARRGS